MFPLLLSFYERHSSRSPEFKYCPPIREPANQELLWEDLTTGLIDCVVSDHSPCVAELKNFANGDIMGALGGISTLGLGLSLLWTEGRKWGVGISQIIDWTSRKTAEHAGLGHLNGQLKVGLDGDFIIWDPDAEFSVCLGFLVPVLCRTDPLVQVTADPLNSKDKVSPYVGLALRGQVEKTFLRGSLIYEKDSNRPFGDAAHGRLL